MLMLVLLLSLAHSSLHPDDDWWYDMDTAGSNWGTSSRLTNNPYYNTYRQIARQMSIYGPAHHVGKIYRGKFLNPELDTPRNRAFGYQSDFNPRDLQSGAFSSKPQGQKFRASEVHVNEGLASYVGEVRTLPIGQHVQDDGTILMQTDGRRSPCNPNPCRRVRMPTCTVVNRVTAKCSRSEDYKLTLTWEAPPGSSYNAMYLCLVPAFHNGSKPPLVNGDTTQAWIYGGEDEGYGVIPDAESYDYAYEDRVPNRGVNTHTLGTADDGSKYQDYTYQVIAEYSSEYLDVGKPTLTVEYGGEVKQILSAPQADGFVDVDADDDTSYYFFGCFRPQLGIVDTRGAGFHEYEVNNMNGLQIFYDYNLCKALQDWPGTPGYNF